MSLININHISHIKDSKLNQNNQINKPNQFIHKWRPTQTGNMKIKNNTSGLKQPLK